MHRRLSKIEIIITRSPVVQLMKRHKRHADMQLYRVLSDCLEIAEICLLEPKEYGVLDGLVKKLPEIDGKKRHYVERSSDIYQRVCRFMFYGEEHSANTNRYAHCLREAARQGIKSKKLIDQLSCGGIAKFYLKRPSQGREIEVSTKCLRLDRAVKHYRRDAITLKLKRGPEGIYEVIEQSWTVMNHESHQAQQANPPQGCREGTG